MVLGLSTCYYLLMLQFTPENAPDFKRNKTLIRFSYGNVYDNPTFYNWLWDVLQCKQRTLRPVFHYLCFIHFGVFFFVQATYLVLLIYNALI